MQKTKTTKDILSKIAALISLTGLVLVSVVGPLAAQTLNQGFQSDEPLQKGMMIKQKDNDNTKIEPVSRSSLKDLKGVVVEKNESPVTIASEGQTIFVASSGRYEVLVSDENKEIKKGDYISISSLNGIGMKADSEQSIVLGRAVEDFNGRDGIIGQTTTQDNKSVNFGRIDTDIAIGSNPLKKENQQSTIPRVLTNISSSVTGKQVSTARIWLASIVFLITSVVTVVMLYGGSKSSLLALGRNPLSKSSINRALLQVVLFAIIVFISGMFGVYLLLKL